MNSSGTSIVTRSTGSCATASISRRDDLGVADGELEALAAHRLDEHRQLELAAAEDLDASGVSVGLDAEREVADELSRRAAR